MPPILTTFDYVLNAFRWLWNNALDIAAVVGIASAAVRALEDGVRAMIKRTAAPKPRLLKLAWAIDTFDGFLGFCIRALYVVALTRRKTVLPS